MPPSPQLPSKTLQGAQSQESLMSPELKKNHTLHTNTSEMKTLFFILCSQRIKKRQYIF